MSDGFSSHEVFTIDPRESRGQLDRNGWFRVKRLYNLNGSAFGDSMSLFDPQIDRKEDPQ